MKVAYADPPYPGMGHLYDGREVNHALLLAHLDDDFDAWAYSCASKDLREIMPIAPPCRVAAWVKPFAAFKKGVCPAYAWEPVLFKPGRAHDALYERDYVEASITLQRGFTGAKPSRFCYWLFQILGCESTDEFHDLFPGSGAVSEAWDAWSRQGGLWG